MIKAVLFDLDNTLVDFMRMKKAACDEAIAAMIDAGLEMRKDQARDILFDLYNEHGIEDKHIFQKFLKKTTGKIDYKILASGIVAYRRVKTGFMIPYPGVVSTLLALKKHGVKLAIVSDAPRMRAWLRLASMRLTDFFDAVVTYDDTKHYKPHPLPFKVAIRKLGVKAPQVMMVGDWPERDMKGAKALGMKTCLARYGDTKSRARPRPDYMIESVRDVLKIVERENGIRPKAN